MDVPAILAPRPEVPRQPQDHGQAAAGGGVRVAVDAVTGRGNAGQADAADPADEWRRGG